MKSKMHANCGRWHWKARLSTEQIDALRTAYENREGGYRSLAKQFGVSWVTVRDICRYRRRCQG